MAHGKTHVRIITDTATQSIENKSLWLTRGDQINSTANRNILHLPNVQKKHVEKLFGMVANKKTHHKYERLLPLPKIFFLGTTYFHGFSNNKNKLKHAF